MGLGWTLRDNDWNKLRQILQQIASLRFGPDATPTFAGLDISGDMSVGGGVTANDLTLNTLTASRLAASNADKALVSTDLSSWVTGTANRVTVADDLDGTITLSGPQDIHTAASPTFADLTLSGLSASQALMTDVNKKLISVDYLDQAVKTTSSPTFDEITLTAPLGQYLFTDRGAVDALVLQQTDTTRRCQLELFGSLATIQEVAFKMFAEGIPGSLGVFSMIQFFHGGGAGNPFSLRTVGGGAHTASLAFQIQSGSHTNQLYLATDGRVGIGTATPGYALHVAGTVYGVSTSSFGVYGVSNSGLGVAGVSGSSYGVYGASTNGVGVYGQSDIEIGVYGFSVDAPGVYGTSTNTDAIFSDGTFQCVGAATLQSTLSVTGLSTLVGGISIGQSGNIAKATNDLTITTAAAKTLVLSPAVYKDINIAGALLSKPASSAPGMDTFRTSAAADTGIETYAFDVGEKVHGGFEIQHDYKETTDLVFHVHWQGIAAPTDTDYVQWRLTYIVARNGVTLAAVTTIDSPDVAIDTRYRFYRNDFAAITGTNFKIGDQFMFTLERVAADGAAYAGDCLIATAGIHYQVDTLGSRTTGTK